MPCAIISILPYDEASLIPAGFSLRRLRLKLTRFDLEHIPFVVNKCNFNPCSKCSINYSFSKSTGYLCMWHDCNLAFAFRAYHKEANYFA